MAMLLQLLMNAVPVRLRTLPRRLDRNRLVPKQLGFQFLFAPAFGQRPTDASRSRPLQIVVDRAQPHPATALDLSLPPAPTPTSTAGLPSFSAWTFSLPALCSPH